MKHILLLVTILSISMIMMSCEQGSKPDVPNKENAPSTVSKERDSLPQEVLSESSPPQETDIPKNTTNSVQDEGSTDLQNKDVLASKEISKDGLDTYIPRNIDRRVKVKGLYLTASSASVRLDHYINLANTTEVNAYVIDYKNDEGIVYADSKVQEAVDVGAVRPQYKAKDLTAKLRANNIYSIARIVCFKDPIYSKKKPDVAIKNLDGSLMIQSGMTWMNPHHQKAWEYNVALAKEALENGFDEVQFDYIRFPAGKKDNMDFGEMGDLELFEVINQFLAYARREMPTAILSGDVFAIICESPGDFEKIGQHLEKIGAHLDYISPMAYPSHYARNQIINDVKFPKPDLDPYGIIKNTLLKAKSRIEQVEGHKPILRTYLQDFTASWIGDGNYQTYGASQVRQQINGVYDSGNEEWILWDHMNTYSEGAFIKE